MVVGRGAYGVFLDVRRQFHDNYIHLGPSNQWNPMEILNIVV